MRFGLALAALCLSAQDAKPPEKVVLPTTPADIERGKALYLGSCTYCHGPQGDGGKGANLARPNLDRAKTDGDLARIIEVGVPGTEMPGAWHMTRREVTQTAAYVRTLGQVEIKPVPGDAAAGKALFAKHGCAACHTVKEGSTYTGGFQGPDLSSIGTRRSPQHVKESVLDPGASVPEDFVHAMVVLKSGKSVTGRRLSEDTFAILVRDYEGNNHAFRKNDVKEIQKDRKKSPMPSYRGKMTESELANLVAYLASLKEAQ